MNAITLTDEQAALLYEVLALSIVDGDQSNTFDEMRKKLEIMDKLLFIRQHYHNQR